MPSSSCVFHTFNSVLITIYQRIFILDHVDTAFLFSRSHISVRGEPFPARLYRQRKRSKLPTSIMNLLSSLMTTKCRVLRERKSN